MSKGLPFLECLNTVVGLKVTDRSFKTIFRSFHVKEGQKIEKFNPPSQFFLKSAPLLPLRLEEMQNFSPQLQLLPKLWHFKIWTKSQ